LKNEAKSGDMAVLEIRLSLRESGRKLEMLVETSFFLSFETQIETLHGQSSFFFSNEPFEKRPWMTIEDFGLHSDDHFKSHLLGIGLYRCQLVQP